MDLIKNFNDFPEITCLVLAILFVLGAITRGNINLGFTKIPELDSKQSSYLLGLGVIFLFAAGLLAFKGSKNHPPEADDNDKVTYRGDTVIINLASLISDKNEEDILKVAIVQHPKEGYTDLDSDSKTLIYIAANNRPGEYTDTVTYQVSDTKLQDTGQIIITIKEPEARMVDVEAQLKDIFGLPKTGKHKIEIDEQIKDITVLRTGDFNVEGPENELAYLLIEEDKLPVDIREAPVKQLVEYDPIDSIAFTFCSEYNRSKLKPSGTIFKDRFNISFSQLVQSDLPNNDGTERTSTFGKLFIGLVFYGSDDDLYKNAKNTLKLDFTYILKREQAATSPSEKVEITAGTTSYGWRSYASKLVRRGSYELIIFSRNGQEIQRIEFEIK